MKLKNTHVLAFLAALILFSGVALGTEFEMKKLPAYSLFSCILCHISPTGGDFNAFGAEFNANGRLWSPDLAILDSDNDGCTNGSELGDVDGNGDLDEGIYEESSNPGSVGDCSSASVIDDITWGQLKAMFDTR